MAITGVVGNEVGSTFLRLAKAASEPPTRNNKQVLISGGSAENNHGMVLGKSIVLLARNIKATFVPVKGSFHTTSATLKQPSSVNPACNFLGLRPV